MSFLLILLSGGAMIAFYYFWTFGYWKKRGVKTLTPNLFFGNLSGVVFGKIFIREVFKEIYAMCKQTGDKYMGFYFLNTPVLVITDLELVKRIYTTNFDHFTDRLFYLNEKDPLTINIVSAKGHQWKAMREKLSPAFSPSKMKNMCLILGQVGDHLKLVLDKSTENSETVELQDVTSKFVTDSIGMSAFGIECNTLQNLNKEFKKYTQNTFGGSFTQNIKFVLSVLCPSVLQFFKIPFNSVEIQNFFLNLVKSTVEYREKNNIVRGDLMDSMIQLRNNIDVQKEDNLNFGNVSKTEKSLKIDEITAQTLIFFGAAYESSSSTITLCIYELALNEDVQKKLREEIVSVLKKYEGKISYDAIIDMIYLEKCVLETLRKHAIIPLGVRRCSKRYQLPNSDVVLNVGDAVYIPVYDIHHDPKYYPNPERFDPERFSPENKAARPSCTFLAFGEGQRNCVGYRLGLLQIKIFLVTFLSNYNFTINSKVKLPAAFSKSSAVAILKDPLYLNIKKI